MLAFAYPLSVMASFKIPLYLGGESRRCFPGNKKIMVSLPVLALPDFDKPFIVETNASDFAVGDVLLQVGNNFYEHPVAFNSSKMLLSETS